MSIFGRLVGGAAQAGSQIAMRYVDDQIATQRAQMMAELQRRTAGQVREDDDAFRNDPTRVQRDRERRSADIASEGSARNKTDLAGKLAEATNTGLTQGMADRESIIAGARSKAEQAAVTAAGNDPAYLKAKGAITAAGETSGSRASAALARHQLNEIEKVAGRAADIRSAQTELSKETDPTKRDAIQQRVSDLQFSGKDPSKFLALAERAQDNAREAIKLLADPATAEEGKRQLAKANELSRKAAQAAGLKLSDDADPFAIPGAKPGKGADPYAKLEVKPAPSSGIIDRVKAKFDAAPEPQAKAADPAARAAEIKRALAVDDDIKSGVGGSATRMLRSGALPMGMAQRRDLEADLAKLTGR